MGAERQIPEEKRGASIEELAKRMVTIDNSDEDLARLLANNWQNILWGIILLGIALLVFREFQATREKKAGEISQRFSEVQQDFQKLVSGKPGDEATPALRENLRLLTTNYSDDNYGRLARLYQASLLRSEKKIGEARSAITGFPVNGLFSTPAPKPLHEVRANDFVLELAALLAIRLNIEDGAVPPAEVRKQLTGLAYGSRFVTSEALIALYRLSRTQSEREEAGRVTKSVLDARNSLKGAILRELSGEDIQVEGESHEAAAVDVSSVETEAVE